MMEAEGYVDRITFRNEENGYTVLYLSDPSKEKEEEKETCCVGYFSFVSEGEYLLARGNEVIHRNYGRQLQVESYEEKTPDDEFATERYLGSGAIKGIGPALAARIVRKFGADTFSIIEKEPERLAEVKGISMKMAVNIAGQFSEKRQTRHAMMFLQDYGISINMAVKIYKYYKDDIYEVLHKNPYKLAEDITGIGFKFADAIAQKAGFQLDSEYRIRAGIIYSLQQSGAQGHCYLPENELVNAATELLLTDREIVAHETDALALDKEIVIQETGGERRLYISRLYYMELNCARMLLDLNIHFPVNMAELKEGHRKTSRKKLSLMNYRSRQYTMLLWMVCL